MIPILSELIFNMASIDTTLSGPEFLVTIDPNLEEILQIFNVKKFALEFVTNFRVNFLTTLSGPEFSSPY